MSIGTIFPDYHSTSPNAIDEEKVTFHASGMPIPQTLYTNQKYCSITMTKQKQEVVKNAKKKYY